MRKLLEFLVGKRHWFLFVVLEAVALALVYRNTSYQRSVMLSSAGMVTGYISSYWGDFLAYLNLREVNRELTKRNGELEMEILRLRYSMEELAADTAAFGGYVSPDSIVRDFPYTFITAEVVSNSISHISNYITLDCGTRDSVAPDMGVVSDWGVVGIVSTVSERYAVVIPLINPKSHISCKLLGSDFFGTLSWDGRDARFATLEKLPRHMVYAPGDTVITSGYSAVFPAGIIVGTVDGLAEEDDNDFFSLRVRLATDFATLRNVRVIRNYDQAEQQQILQEATKDD